MNLLEKIILHFGFVNVNLYKERIDEGNYFAKALEQSLQLLEDIQAGEINNDDVKISNFIKLYSNYHN